MSTPHPLLDKEAGRKELLLGNEAIVRGAVEAGVQFVTCYPGTPSSEAPDTFFKISPHADYYFEYSVNEKVAIEVAGGATLSGALTMTTMKHVGVNVAADPLMTLAYTGTPGGYMLLSADDPGCHSSQNEQDNRLYARLAGLPVFEPATPQEARDYTRLALTLSREWGRPVMLRTTTRVNHVRGPVTFNEATTLPAPEGFVKDVSRFVPVPVFARSMHERLLDALAEIVDDPRAQALNTISGDGPHGVIASGVARAYVADVVADIGPEHFSVFDLGFSYPLPEARLLDFVRGRTTVTVVEEGEPVVETELRALVQRHGMDVTIIGKVPTPDRQTSAPGLSRLGEYDTDSVRQALAHVLGEAAGPAPTCAHTGETGPLPGRPPNLCSGCPHRSAFFAVRKVFGDEAVYSSDIGCYTLGLLPPLAAADFLLCMGSSVSAGTGASRAASHFGKPRPVVAFIGDSTWFHSGLTGLVNAVYNQHDLLLVILDNHTTAMTGHQPHPGVHHTIHGEAASRVDVEASVRGCGVDNVVNVNPLNVKKFTAALEEMKAASGVRVIIAEEPCPLHAKRVLGKKPATYARATEQNEALTHILNTLGCPSFKRTDEGDIAIDANTCAGCMTCVQTGAPIKATKRG